VAIFSLRLMPNVRTVYRAAKKTKKNHFEKHKKILYA